MRSRYGQVYRLALPAKALASRFGYLALAVAALALLFLGKTHADSIERFRTTVIDAVAPVLAVLSSPVQAANDVGASIDRFWFTHEENEHLREQMARLTAWRDVAGRLEQENAMLRAQLNLRVEPRPYYISARVIADSGGPFVRTVLVNAGSRDGVKKGQAAITGAGLAGRIAEVGVRSSRLLLLTDLNSRVPVAIASSRHRAILAGDNSDMPRLIFLPPNAQARPGDRIVTSGHGGVFPPGLPVGVIAAVSEGDVRVQSFAPSNQLQYVTVLRFDLPQLSGNPPDKRGAQ